MLVLETAAPPALVDFTQIYDCCNNIEISAIAGAIAFWTPLYPITK
ncbi:hypothetical protein [Merismopedia glauca]|nr:hypothetical protein [Merismopedia glauca]